MATSPGGIFPPGSGSYVIAQAPQGGALLRKIRDAEVISSIVIEPFTPRARVSAQFTSVLQPRRISTFALPPSVCCTLTFEKSCWPPIDAGIA